MDDFFRQALNTSSSGLSCSLASERGSRDLYTIAITTVTNALAFGALVIVNKFLINKAITKYKKGTKRNESWLVFAYCERPRMIQHKIVPMTVDHHSHPLSSVTPHYSFAGQGSPELSAHSTEVTLVNDLKSTDRSRSMAVFNENEMVDCLHGRASSVAENYSDTDGIFYISDEAIRNRRGVDALNYLLFLRHLIYFLAIVSALCTFVILPINLKGNDTRDAGLFSRLTIENISTGSNYFWAHIVVANLFLPIGILILLHNYAASVLDQERFASRTLFIRKQRSKKTKLAREDVVTLIKEATTNEMDIEGIQFVYDVRVMMQHKNEFISNFSAEKFCLEYLDTYDESFELRPYRLGQWLGLLGVGFLFPKTFGLTYYRRRKWEAIRNLIRDYSKTIARFQEAFFITFKTESMAQLIHQKINRKICRSKCCTGLSKSRHEIDTWKSSFAPDPMDINWDALVVKKKGMWVKSFFVNTTLFLVFFFCTTPSFILPYISHATSSETLDRIRQQYVNELEPISFLAQYFKPLVLLLVASILPNVVFHISSLVPDPLKSEQTHAVMWRTYCFMILMIIIIPALGQSSFHEVVRSIVSQQTFQWYCLFHSYEYSFFVIYIVQSAFIGNGIELVKLSRIISYFIVKLSQISEAEFDHGLNQMELEFNLGLKYSQILFMVTMVLIYSVSCPLITICGLIYMVLKYYVDRHSLYHSCYPSSVSCKTYRRITVMFFSTIVMTQFHLFTICYTKLAPTNALAFDLILLLISLLLLPFLTSLVPSAKSPVIPKNLDPTGQQTTGNVQRQTELQHNWCCCAYLPTIIKQLGKSKFKPKPFNVDDSELNSLDTTTKD